MKANEIITPLQDLMINKMILETLLTKGKITIEEAQFMNELIENVVTRVFESKLNEIEEAINQKQSSNNKAIEETNEAEAKTEAENKAKVELDESTMIKLFLKK